MNIDTTAITIMIGEKAEFTECIKRQRNILSKKFIKDEAKTFIREDIFIEYNDDCQ